jgi:hypothetical protein
MKKTKLLQNRTKEFNYVLENTTPTNIINPKFLRDIDTIKTCLVVALAEGAKDLYKQYIDLEFDYRQSKCDTAYYINQMNINYLNALSIIDDIDYEILKDLTKNI